MSAMGTQQNLNVFESVQRTATILPHPTNQMQLT
jgi:hypothetical protein